jgi:hypothetical protein
VSNEPEKILDTAGGRAENIDMRSLITVLAVLAVLALSSCQLVTSGPESEPGPTELAPAPQPAPAPTGTAPRPPPAAVPDQDLEVAVEGAPELSGRFWAGDAVCLPPGERVTIRPLAAGGSLALSDAAGWRQAGGSVTRAESGGLVLAVPRGPARRFRLELRGQKTTAFPLCVLTEASVEREGRAGTWRVRVGKELIGTYPNPAESRSRLVREHAALYGPPRFFLKIDGSAEKLQLAPHLLAGQMVSFIEVKRVKTQRRHTLWFPPNRPLIEKVERLSRELLAEGLRFRRLVVNSGFRTPTHNRDVKGGSNSRHIYGDAVDVMIDRNGDDRMDDLNGDGVCDARDALVIAQALRKLELAGRVKPGGIGVYGYDTADSCAAFVHLDSRGFITRWGTVYRHGRGQALNWWPPEEFKEEESD